MDSTVVLSVGVVCVTILLALGIVGLIFLKVTEKKQEEMTKREQERTEARQAKYRNEMIERQMAYGNYAAEPDDSGNIFEALAPLIGQFLGGKGGVSADTAASFPGQSGTPEPSPESNLSEGVRLV